MKRKYSYTNNRARTFNGLILFLLAPAIIAILIGDQINSMFGVYFAAIYELIIIATAAYIYNDSFRKIAKKTIIIDKILMPMVACINYANKKLSLLKYTGFFNK